jgi:hypothetical protein
MSLKSRKRTILAKIESSYGVDPTPTGSANAILLRNLNVVPLDGELVNRDLIRPYFGNSDTLVAATRVSLDFEVELAGSGAAGTAPAYSALLKAAAMAETVDAGVSVTYAPVSSSIGSVTIYFNNDGILHKITGARGSVEINITAKQIPVLRFNFTGIYNAPTDTAAPTVDYTNFIQPQVANTAHTTSFSLLGYSGYLMSAQFNVANEVVHRELIGFEAVEIVDRKPSGTFVIEAPTIAAKNFFTAAVNGDVGVFTITHGDTAGSIIELNAPKVSIGNPAYQDDNGVQMLSIPFTASPDTGNDDFEIVFT